MATLTLSITSVANGTVSKTFTVTEAQFAAFIAAYKLLPLRSPPIPFLSLNGPGLGPLTDSQALLAWANAVFSQIVQFTVPYQQAQAAANVVSISSST